MKKEYQTFIIVGIILFILSDFAIRNFFISIILWVIAALLIYLSIRLNEEDMLTDKKENSEKDEKKNLKKDSEKQKRK